MRVIISGGGTGGHIYPALALVEAIKAKEPDSEFLYVGSKRGLESTIVPATGLSFMALEMQGFKRNLSLDNLKTVKLFWQSVKQAKQIIKDFKPDVVVGTGGYVSGAVLYAAQRLKLPTVIHEQNSIAGVTNKFLSRGATKIGIAFKVVASEFPKDKVVYVGNPRAQQVANQKSKFSLKELGLKVRTPTVLIFGGSQGAPAINLATIGAMKRLNDRKYQTIFVTGKKRYKNVLSELKKRKIEASDMVRVVPYLDNMPEVLPKISLVVGRSGATSLAELEALGIPSLLIPSPNVTADHQTNNAEALVDAGAAEMIREKELTAAVLIHEIDSIMDDKKRRTQMAKSAKALGITDAADQLYEVMKSAIAENTR